VSADRITRENEIPALAWLWRVLADPAVTRTAKVVAAAMIYRFDWQNPTNFYEGVRSIGRRTAIHYGRVSIALLQLIEAGHLTRTRREGRRPARPESRNVSYTYSAVLGDTTQTIVGNSSQVFSQSEQTTQRQVFSERGPDVQQTLTNCSAKANRISLNLSETLKSKTEKGKTKTQEAGRNARDKTQEACQAFAEGLRRDYRRAEIEKRDPIIAEAVRRLGGWRRLGQTDVKMAPYYLKEFREKYREIAEADTVH
jgi:hypothetical protein